jgi:uncharacterized membrane protein YcaP (DUF421 family)
MLVPSIGIGELLFRVAVVYAAVFFLMRVVGKKHVGELAPLILSFCFFSASACKTH